MPSSTADVRLEPARSDDLDDVLFLLGSHGLPQAGVAEHVAHFQVARRAGRLVACAGLEPYGDAVLLRSVVVQDPGQGLGGALVDRVLAHAHHRGARLAVLRTTTAPEFFARRGFRTVSAAALDDAVPEAVRRSVEFRGACPASAITMVRSLQCDLRVRPARQSDMPAVLAIYNHEVLHSTATYQYEPRSLEEQVQQWLARQSEGHGFFVAATPDEQVAGYANYGLFRPREGWRFTCEHSVYVHPAWRGKGVARLLMPAVMSHARSRGLHAMVGVVDAANEASIRMHRAMGFELAGVVKEGGYKFDRWLDVAFVQARL